ncbi:MAG: hypothetical protein JW837_12490 [Sedimentisphaerales bacterium]|nr:hypothetical protein [Sedimentisphaerales bacterium]
MNKKTVVKIVLVLLGIFNVCLVPGGSCKSPDSGGKLQATEIKVDEIDTVLTRLNEKTSQLVSLQAQMEYRFTQPLLESTKLQKGIFYYSKFGNDSKLRLNFQTSKIDEEDEEKYREEYIVLNGAGLSYPGRKFEGIWAVQIDYEMEALRYIQLTQASDPNKPMDVFDLINENFPMIGFSKIEDIRKQFEISLVKQKDSESGDFVQVHLKVKPNSVYKDSYVSIDFWIDKKLWLPVKIVTVSTEPATEPAEMKDVSEIKFIKPEFNKKINRKVFDIKIPEGFDEPDIQPISKKN